MDGGRFDGLARALASSKTRRGYLVATLGFLGAAALAVRGTTESSLAACRGEGKSCALNSGCCSGLTCVRTSALNPNVGVCQRGGAVTPTRSPSFRTPTPTPRPTSTPTPVPGRTILVPMTIRLNCPLSGPQSIEFIGRFGRRRRFQIDVVSFRSFLGQSAGGMDTPGPTLTRVNQSEHWLWRCERSRPPGTSCRTEFDPFFDNRFNTDGARFRIRYERTECTAQVSCAQGRSPGNELQCVRV
jgi:hypothetical protein